MNFSFYPTTLLSQIDAAIGGKNGIDFKKYKNVVGTINLPKEVVIDPLSILSLDDETFIEGLIEGYKMALISGNDFYKYFKENLQEILNRNLYKLSFFIKRSVEEKLRIVEQDFKDTGLRSCLNLGHTLGHAFEATTGIAHGLSVGWGLIKEIDFFYKKKYLKEKDYLEIKDTLETLVPEKVKNIQIGEKDIYYYLSNDKKIGANQKIKLPILKSPGNVIIEEIKIKEGEIF
jgi:shikimate kinase/3-dehydroquinate synthase